VFVEGGAITVPYQVVANGISYTVVDDCRTTLWAVITGQVTDEALGEFSVPGFAVDLSRDDLGSRTTEKGLYAVTAYPERSFPQHSTVSYPVDFTLTAPGFHDFPMSVTIPAASPFPVSALTVAMRRKPVVIQGRVVSVVTRAPIANATVLSADNPATPLVHVTALRTPLSFAHALNAPLQSVTFTVNGSTTLQDPIVGGTGVINLASRAGIGSAVGLSSVLRISNAAKTQVEYAFFASMGPGPAGSPGLVYLRNPLNRSYPKAGSTVELVTANPGLPSVGILTDARAGDGVVLAPQLFTSAVAIDAASPALAEYREVGAITDADGYYSLAGIGRLQEVFLKAASGASSQTQGWYIDYGLQSNIVDFRL
jgi:hypothetical protein